MRQGIVYCNGKMAGIIAENENGYTFTYDSGYIEDTESDAVSLTLPLRVEPFHSKVLFPFFDGLIPEGWLLNIAERNWKIRRNDRMALLLTCCHDCIGNVSVMPPDNKSVQ